MTAASVETPGLTAMVYELPDSASAIAGVDGDFIY
jgi:hypothetical protein